MKHPFLALLILLLSANLCAENTSVLQTKNKLHQLDNQIKKLQEELSSAHDKRSVLNRELAGTEKQIGETIHQLHTMRQSIDSKQKSIAQLQQHINTLNQQLAQQQQLLSKHIRIRYKMGEYQPIKWILNQDDPYAISRLLTYYQYIVQSRQRVIDNIDATKKNLTLNHERLKVEIASQSSLLEQLHVHQGQLEQDKHYHKEVLNSLNHEIQNQQYTLSEYEKNKKNLSRLLEALASETVKAPQPRQPFASMRHRLPKPIANNLSKLQPMNQGLTFFAGEGTAVHAVYPGKVVFSDWLNGYGLLLIIDHGQGFMTLYAHNQSLFKEKGASVLQGEQIAAVGHTGGIKQNGLYFEVRQRGKAVPAREWLS